MAFSGTGGQLNSSSFAETLVLDPADPVPRYLQLATAIQRAITRGVLVPGEQLPPERELAELAGVSRMTARQALARLEQNGVLDVRHGVGTFVAVRTLVYDAVRLQAFSESARATGRTPSTRLLSLGNELAEPEVARQLRLQPGEMVITIRRLRLIDDEPILLETSRLSATRFAALLDADLERESLYALLDARFGVQLSHAEETVEAVQAGANGAALALDQIDPVLVVSGVAFQGPEPIEHFRALYRADRVKLAINSERQALRACYALGWGGMTYPCGHEHPTPHPLPNRCLR